MGDNLLQEEFVNKSGDTMTGPLALSQEPVVDAQAATKRYVDTVIANLRTLAVLRDGSQGLSGSWAAGSVTISIRELIADILNIDYIRSKAPGGSITIASPVILAAPLVFARSAFTDGDATPSVAGGPKFVTANTAPTTITDFDGGVSEQQIEVMFGDNNTTIAHNGALIILQGAIPVAGNQYSVFEFVNVGGLWIERFRNVK